MRVCFGPRAAVCTMAVGVALLIASGQAGAQGTRSDYQRASSLRERTAGKVYRDRVRARWLEDATRFWYDVDLPGGGREYVLADAEAGTRGPAFDHERLAAALADEAGEAVDPRRLALGRLVFVEEGSGIRFTFGDQRYECDLAEYELRPLPEEEGSDSTVPRLREARASRRTGEETSIRFVNRTGGEVEIHWMDLGGRRRSYGVLAPGERRRQHTFAGHVWAVTDAAGETVAVFAAAGEPGDAVIDGSPPPVEEERRWPRGRRSRSRSPDGRWTAFVRDFDLRLRDEEGGEERALAEDGSEDDSWSERVHWSPDSRLLVAMKVRAGTDRQVHILESAPEDQLQPRLHSYDYRKPGDDIPTSRPTLFEVADGRRVSIPDELFPTPWSLSDVHWWPDSERFTFLFNQRGHQVLRVIEVDASSGQARALIDEQSDTFVDYAHKHFCRFLDSTREIVWMSERSGWNHLYLYDAETGEVKNPITSGEWVVRGVDRVDEESRRIWFRAGGIRPGQDPYHVHHCRVDLDGTDLVILTEGDGTHSVDLSPDGRFLLDRWSRVDQPPVTELRDAEDGRLICEVERADWSELLATGWRPPLRFVAEGRDGATDIHGILIRPMGLDPDRRYPVIEQIYAGPQGAFVPKSFGLHPRQQALAELGFVVVQIDGMGTSQRSKAFHDVCWRNLGDSGFPDRIAWMRAAADEHPWMDLSRVGVYGGSAGGQSALRALLAHGDHYQVAVADCGCHDNRMDKIWWNELWMGWPVGPHYEEQSNVTQAHRLEGKLLLTVGELDRNVDPASTMQVVDALVRADKDFDLLIVPGGGHGVGESPYASRRRMDFLVRHLLGVEPRARP